MKLVVLDRDGVINELRDDYVKSLAELYIYDQAVDLINFFLESSTQVCVASNQAGVGKNIFPKSTLNKINEQINMKLIQPINFYYCTHKEEDNCSCRKPKPGLLDRIAEDYGIKPDLFIGDNITDYYAAKSRDIKFCLVKTGLGEKYSSMVDETVSQYENLHGLLKELS